MAVANHESQRALAVHQSHLDRMTRREGLPVIDAGVDFDAEESSCPACGHSFRTQGVVRCPDCGLRLSQ